MRWVKVEGRRGRGAHGETSLAGVREGRASVVPRLVDVHL